MNSPSSWQVSSSISSDCRTERVCGSLVKGSSFSSTANTAAHGIRDLRFLTRDWTRVPCRRQSLNHWTTREVPGIMSFPWTLKDPSPPPHPKMHFHDFSTLFMPSPLIVPFPQEISQCHLQPCGTKETPFSLKSDWPVFEGQLYL